MKKIFIVLMISTLFLPPKTSAQNTNYLNEMMSQQAIIADFQVNENAGSSDQSAAKVVVTGNGDFIVAWQDLRNGDADIYARWFAADGTPYGDDFKVNDDSGFPSQIAPSIAASGNGDFVIAWTDERNESETDYDIYAQRFSSAGTPLGSNFRVNDDSGETLQRSVTVAMSGSGNFIVVWEDRRNGNADIYAQRYAGDGSATDVNFLVNDDQTTTSQDNPVIAADQTGNFVITWNDLRDGNFKIYAQRFLYDATAVGGNFKVSEDVVSGRQWYSSVAMNDSGAFVVTWQDERQSNDIYAQRYSSDGLTTGVNFQVNDDNTTTSARSPAVSIDSSGNYNICWYAAEGSNFNLYAQRFATDGSAVGSNFEVNDDVGEGWQLQPHTATNSSGDLVIVWDDTRNLYSDIYAQRIAGDGTLSGSNFRINNDTGSSHQLSPVNTVDENGNFVIAWNDHRGGLTDIYARRFNNAGSALGSDIKVNDDQGIAHHEYVDIAGHSSGSFVITWRDTRNNGDADVYGQMFSSAGSLQGGNFRVNDDAGDVYQQNPAVAMDSSGSFIVVWQDNRGGDDDIYVQNYASDGTALLGNYKISDDISGEKQSRPDISVDGEGHYFVMWQDRRDGNQDVFVQVLDNNGVLTGSNFKLNDDSGTAGQYIPVISAFGNGNCVAVWEDYRNNRSDVYAQIFAADGSVSGENFRVNSDTSEAYIGNPEIAADDSGNFVIVWQDERGGDPDVMGQKYQNGGILVGENFMISEPSEKSQFSPHVILWNNKIYNTWYDSRGGGSGFDIWANVLSWEETTGIRSGYKTRAAQSIMLGQNYPNPFNPLTAIHYQLSAAGEVNLSIFNINGQLVRTLVRRLRPAGKHTVQWNGRDDAGRIVSSGLYIYRLSSGDQVKHKRLLLMK